MKKLKVYAKTLNNFKIEPITVYQNYVKNEQGFLLESYSEETGRYSFIAKQPKERIKSTNDSIIIAKEDNSQQVVYGNPIEALKEYMSEYDVIDDTGLPFTGGIVGVIGYDFIRYSENLPELNPDELNIEPI